MKPFVTGTAAYGPFREDSDIDIVMMFFDARSLRNLLEKAQVEIQEPNQVINPVYTGYEFDVAGRSFNIIEVASLTEYEDWLRATEAMRNHAQIENRADRIACFKHRLDIDSRSEHPFK